MPDIAANLAAIEARIDAACAACGRDRSEVRLLPVSKTKPSELVEAAYAAGYRRFGENRVQEAQDKWEALRDRYPDLEWAVIGRLQPNKAKYVARFATELQALDSLDTARELNRRLQSEGRRIDVLVQVNTSREPQKAGVAPEDVDRFTQELRAFDALHVTGLMTLAVLSPERVLVGACFQSLRDIRDSLRQRDSGGWEQLSMGMSGDFELAIEHGSTCVRVGQAIFGQRPAPTAA